MRCPNCGLDNPLNARFCANCGTPFGPVQEPPQGAYYPQPPPGPQFPPPRNSIWKNIGLGCLIAFLVFVVFGLSCTRACFHHRYRTTHYRYY